MFSAIFFLCLHLFLYGFVYDVWGGGNIPIVIISSVQVLVGIYMFLFAFFDDNDILAILYAMHIPILVLSGLVLAPVLVVTILAFFAFKQAD